MGVEDIPVELASQLEVDAHGQVVEQSSGEGWAASASSSAMRSSSSQLVNGMLKEHGMVQAELHTKGVQRSSCVDILTEKLVLHEACAMQHNFGAVSGFDWGSSSRMDLGHQERTGASRVALRRKRLDASLLENLISQHSSASNQTANAWKGPGAFRSSSAPSFTGLLDEDDIDGGMRRRTLIANLACITSNDGVHDVQITEQGRNGSISHLLVQIAGVNPQDLAQWFARSEPLIIIDVRTRLLFHMDHIVDANDINVLLDQAGLSADGAKASAADDEVLVRAMIEFLKERGRDFSAPCEVVIYDHGGPDLSASYSRAARLTWLLGERFEEGLNVARISMLEGGFANFVQVFPDLCRKNEASSCAANTNSECLEKLLKSNFGRKLYSQLKGQNFFNVMNGNVDKASQILPYLYLGCQRDAADMEQLTSLGITHILVVGSELESHFEGHHFVYKHLRARDALDEPIEDFFNEACEFLDEIRKDDHSKVLIHCFAGVSRSATVTIAYLISLNYTLHAAFEVVRERRPAICPNERFMRSLCEWETKVLGISTKGDLAGKVQA